MLGGNQSRSLLEAVCSVDIAELGQRNVAASGDQFCRIQCMPVFSFLGLLLQLTRLAEGHKLGLLGLIEQTVRFGKLAGVERLLCLAGQFGDVRIIRFERRQVALCLLEVICDFDKSRLDFLLRYILFAEDFEKLGDSARGKPQLLRQLGRFCVGSCASLDRRGELIGKGLGNRG